MLQGGQNGILRLTIHDDGQGFHFGHAMLKAMAEHSFGIENLHRLAENVGGKLEFTTAIGEGTQIEVEIPLQEGAHGHSSVIV